MARLEIDLLQRLLVGSWAWSRWVGAALILLSSPALPLGQAGSLGFLSSQNLIWDWGHQLVLPEGFGDAEFTLEIWLKLDQSFPTGQCSGGGRLTNWCIDDEDPHSSSSWWFDGNWLLDGHNNSGWGSGSFDLQFYGGGRLRWLFGDGSNTVLDGETWAVQPADTGLAASFLDGNWHQVTLVRRFVGVDESQLEQWVDGVMVASTISDLRTDMAATYWDTWGLFPVSQQGWFWGVEKGVVFGGNVLEDYKGLVDELRFWSRAKSSTEINEGWFMDVSGSEAGLVGLYRLNEGQGSSACDALASGGCISLFEVQAGTWSPEQAPFSDGRLFADGFETGDLSRWAPTP